MTRREKRVRRCGAICAALTMAALMTACAGAQAKTIQVGSPLSSGFALAFFGGVGSCGFGSCPLTPATLVQTELPEPGANVTSPVDGTVVSYRLARPDGTFAIQVINYAGTPQPTFVRGQSIASSAPTSITSSGVSQPIATNLVLKNGDAVGIRNFPGGIDKLGEICCVNPSGGPSGEVASWYPPLVDGAPPENTFTGDAEIGMQATVRYCKVPNLKGKTPKAARKALTAADCTVGKLMKTKKVRDKKEVVSQSVKPGKAVSDTKPIKLGLSRKG